MLPRYYTSVDENSYPRQSIDLLQQIIMPSTPRQRAAVLAHASHEKKSAESAHRLQQTNDAKKKNWHEKQNGKFLSGARRQREDAAVEEEGGGIKIAGNRLSSKGRWFGNKEQGGDAKVNPSEQNGEQHLIKRRDEQSQQCWRPRRTCQQRQPRDTCWRWS